MRKLIVPLMAVFTFIGGLVCLTIPFLPFGWLLIGITVLLLIPYFSPFEQLFAWIAKKDRTGFSEKARQKVENFYHWIGDAKRANTMRDFLKPSKVQMSEAKATPETPSPSLKSNDKAPATSVSK